jgi:hypothetical protein
LELLLRSAAKVGVNEVLVAQAILPVLPQLLLKLKRPPGFQAGVVDVVFEFVNRPAGRFILRFGSAESKGSGQLQLGDFDLAFMLQRN